jgi:hypothetical protein
MRRFVLGLYLCVVTVSAGLACGSGAFAVCVMVWGPSILDTALGAPPDRTHPAFWLGLVLLLPLMFFGCVAGFMLLGLPVAFRYREVFESMRIDTRDLDLARPLRSYAQNLLSYADRLDRRRLDLRKPDA